MKLNQTQNSTPKLTNCDATFKVTISPPITATKLNLNETIEDFYSKNIGFFELISLPSKPNTTATAQQQTSFSGTFLEASMKPKSRLKISDH